MRVTLLRSEVLSISAIKDSILDAIGNTPLVRLKSLTKGVESEILVKCEFMNPSGSLKDRVAKHVIPMAEKEGRLRRGYTIVEASTGNMGSALALVAAATGYEFICCMPEEMTGERSRIMNMLGAEVRYTGSIFTDEGITYVHREVARQIEASNPNAWWVRQFSNPANVQAHKETTGYEIIQQTGGNIDAFVMAAGTGGTLMGVAKALKEKLPDKKIEIVAVGPERAPILSEGKSGASLIPGVSDGFIPEILDTQIYDRIVSVADEAAVEMAHRLRREEKLFCGISSGANGVASLELAKELGKDSTVVTILPDSADRYYSFERLEI